MVHYYTKWGSSVIHVPEALGKPGLKPPHFLTLKSIPGAFSARGEVSPVTMKPIQKDDSPYSMYSFRISIAQIM